MPRLENLCIRVTRQERAAIDAAAAMAGKAVTTFARDVLLANSQKQATAQPFNDNVTPIRVVRSTQLR